MQRGLEAKSLVKDDGDGKNEKKKEAANEEDANDNDDDEWEPAISRTTRVRRMKREQRNKELRMK